MTTKNNVQRKQSAPDPFVLENLKLATFVAKTGSGKSHLVNHLLYKSMERGHFKWVFVFTQSKCNKEWSDIVGPQNVYTKFDEVWLNELLKAQEIDVAKHGALHNNGLLLFDDMIGAARWSSAISDKLASASRHFGLSVWITSQLFTKIPPMIRMNSAYMFILNSVGPKNAKQIHEEFAIRKQFPRSSDLEAYCEEGILNHGIIKIDNSGAGCVVSNIRAPAKLKPFDVETQKKSKARKTK